MYWMLNSTYAPTVRERCCGFREAADLPAVGVGDHDPGVGLCELGEYLDPPVHGDGLEDVVGRGLVEGVQRDGPVEDVLHGGGAAEVDPGHGLDPGHLLAVRPVEAELREAAVHQWQEGVARAEVHGLELG
jgi:hypothetical protein